MSGESNPYATPGFYNEELPRFDQRQAWTGRLEAGFKDQFIHIGENEILSFPGVRKHTPINRSESQLSLIHRVISSGTAEVTELARIKELSAELREEINNLSPQSDNLDSVYEVWQKVVEQEEIERGDETIYRAAGYIAARKNLWIVTKSVAVETGRSRPRTIGLGRLVGLTFSDTKSRRPLLPVVSGKNGKAGKFDKFTYSNLTAGHPRVLDIVESTVNRSSS
jgi:hypothetical protein